STQLGADFGGWNQLSESTRIDVLEQLINGVLTLQGVPPVKVVADATDRFSYQTWTAHINPKHPAAVAVFKAFHEARHVQQWFGMLRLRAGQGLDAEALRTEMFVQSREVRDRAVRDKLLSGAPGFAQASVWYDSHFGAGRSARDHLLRVELPSAPNDPEVV